jgi:hypothetical protein
MYFMMQQCWPQPCRQRTMWRIRWAHPTWTIIQLSRLIKKNPCSILLLYSFPSRCNQLCDQTLFYHVLPIRILLNTPGPFAWKLKFSDGCSGGFVSGSHHNNEAAWHALCTLHISPYVLVVVYELQPNFRLMESSFRDMFFWNWVGAWKTIIHSSKKRW